MDKTETYDDSNFVNQNSETYLKRRKARLVQLMGGCCVRCGFTDLRALQIDHVNGGGCQQFKDFPGGLSRSAYFTIVEKSFLAKENEYQVLCANCNWIKRHENREYGGRKHSFMNFHRPKKQSLNRFSV